MTSIGVNMNIKWDKEPESIEDKVLADYTLMHSDMILEFVNFISKKNLLTSSFTPKAFDKNFFTYEIRKDNSSEDYLITIWRGIRTGDTTPVLWGRLEYEANKIY